MFTGKEGIDGGHFVGQILYALIHYQTCLGFQNKSLMFEVRIASALEGRAKDPAGL